MSVVFPGGSNISIEPGDTQTWTFTWGNSQWQGSILQPQPIHPVNATLNYSRREAVRD